MSTFDVDMEVAVGDLSGLIMMTYQIVRMFYVDTARVVYDARAESGKREHDDIVIFMNFAFKVADAAGNLNVASDMVDVVWDTQPPRLQVPSS